METDDVVIYNGIPNDTTTQQTEEKSQLLDSKNR
jgi:hypothetical protein